MSTVLIFGSNGQVGSEICEMIEDVRSDINLIKITRDDQDLRLTTNGGFIQKFDSMFRNSDVVINTTAYHNVPSCNEHPELAYKINKTIPEVMASLAKKHNSKFYHFSTDYVFGGESKGKPYSPLDNPSPVNIYGMSKAMGELGVIANNGKVIRVSAVFGKKGCSAKGWSNFITTCLYLIKKKNPIYMVDDQKFFPSYAKDVARVLLDFIDNPPRQRFIHLVNGSDDGEAISWFDILAETRRLIGYKTEIHGRKSDEDPIKRPKYSALLPGEGNQTKMQSWKKALKEYLLEIGEI